MDPYAETCPNRISKCTWSLSTFNKDKSPHSLRDWRLESNLEDEKRCPSVLACIGNTPLVKLNKIPQSEEITCQMYAKLEYFNPGGSVYDRFAHRAILDAEEAGMLKPGDAIICGTNSPLAVSLAMVATVTGHPCHIVVNEKIPEERLNLLNVLGAKVHTTHSSINPQDLEGMFGKVEQIHDKNPFSLIINQFNNPAASLCHYDGTAEEILDCLLGNVHMVACCVNTGGTITGIGRKLKQIDESIEIVGANEMNSEESVFYMMSSDWELSTDCPTILDQSVINTMYKIEEGKGLVLARRLIKEEGILCGPMGGKALAAALEAAAALPATASVVVIIPDSMNDYLSDFVLDQVLEAKGFKECENTLDLWWWNKSISDLKLKPLVVIKTSYDCHKALHLLKKMDIHQAPLVDEEGALRGVIVLDALINELISGAVSHYDPITSFFCLKNYTTVAKTAPLGAIARLMEVQPFALIVEQKKVINVNKAQALACVGKGEANEDEDDEDARFIEAPVCIITAEDLLAFAESNNPNKSYNIDLGGSVYDRFAHIVILDAEEAGMLKPGDAIICGTNSPLAVSLAMVATVTGHPCHIVVNEKIPEERLNLLNVLGAKVHTTHSSINPQDLEGMFGKVEQIHDKNPFSLIINQFNNPAASLCQYDGTAEEILDCLLGNVHMVACCVNTGGTITGIGRKFKQIDESIEIVGANEMNSEESVFYMMSSDWELSTDCPTILDQSVINTMYKIEEGKGLVLARRLIKEEGILCGPMGGKALAAALEAAAALPATASVVVIIPDSMNDYLSDFVLDQVLEAKGLKECENTLDLWWWNKSISDLKLKPLVVIKTSYDCHKALHLLKKMDIHQAPLVDEEGALRGVIVLDALINELISGAVSHYDPITSFFCLKNYTTVAKTAPLGAIARLMEVQPFALIVEQKKVINVNKAQALACVGKGEANEDEDDEDARFIEAPVCIITAEDLLAFAESNNPNKSYNM